MVGFKNGKLQHGVEFLSATHATICTDIGTYYIIDGTWITPESINYGFSGNGSGRITYNGDKTLTFLFNGVSDLSVDKSCEITYGLYINGALVPGAETPHDFANTAKVDSISITNFVILNPGDYIEVWCKSDTITTEVTTNTLMITFLAVDE